MSGLPLKQRQDKNKKPGQKNASFLETNTLKDKAVLLSWIAGLLLLISLLWILTTPLQTRNLLRTVNNVLISNNDSRRLISHLNVKSSKAGLLGYWFMMLNSSDKMFIFTVFQDGILIPLGAVVSDNGKVNDVVPLSAHAVQIFSKLPDSILQIYIQRIETSYAGGQRQ